MMVISTIICHQYAINRSMFHRHGTHHGCRLDCSGSSGLAFGFAADAVAARFAGAAVGGPMAGGEGGQRCCLAELAMMMVG